MIFRVEIENFFSFGDRQEIDLRARKSVRDELGRLSPAYRGATDLCPHVVAVFGANAAGKSNLLRALSFGVWFVTNSFSIRPDSRLPYEKFGSREKLRQQSRLAFFFGGPVDFSSDSNDPKQCPYQYELVLGKRIEEDGSFLPDRVVSERLSYQPKGYGKATTIIERLWDGSVRYSRDFMTTRVEGALKEVIRDQASVFSTLAQLNHDVAKRFIDRLNGVVSNILVDRYEQDNASVMRLYAEHPSVLAELQAVAKRIDLGIEDILVDRTGPEPRMTFSHSGLDHTIDLHRESHGTLRFVSLFPYIYWALERGGIAILDEMDSSIHPGLLPEILRWFYDSERNPLGAQLWMTCHSASLLTELTKEEVLFCEKDGSGQTKSYKMADIQGVRRTESFFDKYIGGEYGAVPNIG